VELQEEGALLLCKSQFLHPQTSHETLVFLSIFFFFGGNGVLTQSFVSEKHVLKQLSHTICPFCSVFFFFGDGVL
jgi:hypothetical protein